MGKRLDKLVNIAVLIACAAILVRVGAWGYHSLVPSSPPGLAKGSKVADTADFKLSSARRTLILVTSSD